MPYVWLTKCPELRAVIPVLEGRPVASYHRGTKVRLILGLSMTVPY
jgi:hypothetical protein